MEFEPSAAGASSLNCEAVQPEGQAAVRPRSNLSAGTK